MHVCTLDKYEFFTGKEIHENEKFIFSGRLILLILNANAKHNFMYVFINICLWN